MRIVVTKDYEEMSKRAADVIFAQVLMKLAGGTVQESGQAL